MAAAVMYMAILVVSIAIPVTAQATLPPAVTSKPPTPPPTNPPATQPPPITFTPPPPPPPETSRPVVVPTTPAPSPSSVRPAPPSVKPDSPTNGPSTEPSTPLPTESRTPTIAPEAPTSIDPSTPAAGPSPTTSPSSTPSFSSRPLTTGSASAIHNSTTNDVDKSDLSSSTGLVLGVSAAVVVVIGGLGYCLYRRHRSKKSALNLPFEVGSSTANSGGMLLSIPSSSTELTLNWTNLEPFKIPLEDIVLVQPVAAGAFGEVWLGTYRNQQVAVKTCLATRASRKHLQSFIDELALVGSLQCPQIVRLVGAGWFRATDLQAVLEFMNMGDLREYLNAHRDTAAFSWPAKLDCALHVAKALAYLHSKRIIHRDLKSRNVLLDTQKGTKLSDFGTSRADAKETMTTGVGTYRWMAPEVLTYKHYTIAVDVFSFGVVLSELDTHDVPYSGVCNDSGQAVSDTALVGMVLHSHLRPKFTPTCPGWFLDLAMACMPTRPSAPSPPRSSRWSWPSSTKHANGTCNYIFNAKLARLRPYLLTTPVPPSRFGNNASRPWTCPPRPAAYS